MRYLLPTVLIFVLMFAAEWTPVSAFSLKELLGFGDEKKEEMATGNQKQNKLDEPEVAKQKQPPEDQWVQNVTEKGSASSPLDYKYVHHLFSNMNAQERDNLLNNKESFQKALENEATNRAVLSAAVENKLLADENTRFLMRRGAENILREVYLKKLIASKLPADFPSDEQINEYYEKNPSQFELPERIQVWQIFYTKPADAKDKEIKELRQKAVAAHAQLSQGKISFTDLAFAQSEHEPSRVNGGYMGLIQVADLLPAIKDVLLDMESGALSEPVESETGFHILKRGEIVEAEQLPLDEVKSQVEQLLQQQANLQIRQAVFKQANKEYPQGIDDEKINKWQERLRSEFDEAME